MCAHQQYNAGSMSSHTPPATPFHMATMLTDNLEIFIATCIYLRSSIMVFFGTAITTATLYGYIFSPSGSARLAIVLYPYRILAKISSNSSPSFVSPPSTPKNFFLCTFDQLPFFSLRC